MLYTCANTLEPTKNYPKLLKIAKIRPKTISLKKFEIPPKIEIFIFEKYKTSTQRVGTKVCAHYLGF